MSGECGCLNRLINWTSKTLFLLALLCSLFHDCFHSIRYDIPYDSIRFDSIRCDSFSFSFSLRLSVLLSVYSIDAWQFEHWLLSPALRAFLLLMGQLSALLCPQSARQTQSPSHTHTHTLHITRTSLCIDNTHSHTQQQNTCMCVLRMPHGVNEVVCLLVSTFPAIGIDNTL